MSRRWGGCTDRMNRKDRGGGGGKGKKERQGCRSVLFWGPFSSTEGGKESRGRTGLHHSPQVPRERLYKKVERRQ